MFDFLFGWRKASKCRKLIKLIQCRLKLLKNKKSCVMRKLRQDIVRLLKDGNQDVALERAGEIIDGESLVAVYELLDYFCELIMINFSYIRRHRDCPNDLNEAVSSLIFASTRCVDLLLLELGAIPKLFEERYGRRFVMSAVKLCPGNLANSQVKEMLSRISINLVSDDMKHRMVDEIARTNNLTLEYNSKLHQQQQISGGCNSYLDSGISTSTSSSSLVVPCFQGKAALEQDKERVDGKSSTSESSFQFSEDAVIYPDGIQEFHPPTKDSSLRFFMFSSLPTVTEGETFEADDQYDPWNTQKYIEYEDYNDHDESSDSSDSSQEDSHGSNDLLRPWSRGSHNWESATCYGTEYGRNHPDQCAIPVVEQQPHKRRTDEWAITMVAERAEENCTDDLTRASISFPHEHPNHVSHVHPKLPDYEDLVAKFTALKKAYRPTKQPTTGSWQIISFCPSDC